MLCLKLGPLASRTQSSVRNSGNKKKHNLGSPRESVRDLGFGDSEGAPGWAARGMGRQAGAGRPRSSITDSEGTRGIGSGRPAAGASGNWTRAFDCLGLRNLGAG